MLASSIQSSSQVRHTQKHRSNRTPRRRGDSSGGRIVKLMVRKPRMFETVRVISSKWDLFVVRGKRKLRMPVLGSGDYEAIVTLANKPNGLRDFRQRFTNWQQFNVAKVRAFNVSVVSWHDKLAHCDSQLPLLTPPPLRF